jgi:hypothetical protein
MGAVVIAVSIFNVFLLALQLVGGERDEWVSCVTLGRTQSFGERRAR